MSSIDDRLQNDSDFDEALFKAVKRAIDECIKEDILKDFFIKYRKEVIKVGVLEYSAERHLQVIKDEGYALGCRDKENELRPQIDSLTEERDIAVKENERLKKLLEENGIKL